MLEAFQHYADVAWDSDELEDCIVKLERKLKRKLAGTNINIRDIQLVIPSESDSYSDSGSDSSFDSESDSISESESESEGTSLKFDDEGFYQSGGKIINKPEDVEGFYAHKLKQEHCHMFKRPEVMWVPDSDGAIWPPLPEVPAIDQWQNGLKTISKWQNNIRFFKSI